MLSFRERREVHRCGRPSLIRPTASSTHGIVLAFMKEYGLKAKPAATGGPAATFTQVRSGQIDVGWSAPSFGFDAEKDGKIRIVARGNDLPGFASKPRAC